MAVFLSFANLVSPTVQADDLLQDAGSWLQVVGEGSLKVVDPRLEKGRIWLEGQSRFDDNWDHWYQGMVRAAVGYSLSDRATIWAGYTWLPTQNVGKPYVAQQDVWPGFRYVWPTSIGTVSFRTLIETNFLPGNGSDVRVRPRQMIRFMHPLDFEPRLSLITWDEFFVRANTTRAGGQAGFDQNRAFAGLGWTFNKNFRTEVGYLNQYLDDATHTNNTMHHLIMGSLYVNF
ncbi:MAG: DUF2490 domain-containing protein [Methylobacter sp.]|nr:DUF2490 domain-containing protein [Methylobacter sp.]